MKTSTPRQQAEAWADRTAPARPVLMAIALFLLGTGAMVFCMWTALAWSTQWNPAVPPPLGPFIGAGAIVVLGALAFAACMACALYVLCKRVWGKQW